MSPSQALAGGKGERLANLPDPPLRRYACRAVSRRSQTRLASLFCERPLTGLRAGLSATGRIERVAPVACGSARRCRPPRRTAFFALGVFQRGLSNRHAIRRQPLAAFGATSTAAASLRAACGDRLTLAGGARRG